MALPDPPFFSKRLTLLYASFDTMSVQATRAAASGGRMKQDPENPGRGANGKPKAAADRPALKNISNTIGNNGPKGPLKPQALRTKFCQILPCSSP